MFGRNGVGKTTLLKTIAGWITPTAGRDRIRRRGASTGSPANVICRRGVGFVPEDRRIFPGLTVEENLTLGFLQVPGRSRAEDRAALERIYRRFPRLMERRHQLGTTLSGGEQQMLAMARVMVGKPRLLLVDEPSEGLAPMIVADLFAIIGEMKAAGCADPAGRTECASGARDLRSLHRDRARAHHAERQCQERKRLQPIAGGDRRLVLGFEHERK